MLFTYIISIQSIASHIRSKTHPPSLSRAKHIVCTSHALSGKGQPPTSIFVFFKKIPCYWTWHIFYLLCYKIYLDSDDFALETVHCHNDIRRSSRCVRELMARRAWKKKKRWDRWDRIPIIKRFDSATYKHNCSLKRTTTLILKIHGQ